MLEFNTMPQAPLVAKHNHLIADAEARNVLFNMYDNAIDKMTQSAEDFSLSYPLCCALVAKSFHDAKCIDESRRFAKKGRGCITKSISRWYGSTCGGIALQSGKATKRLWFSILRLITISYGLYAEP